jgi:hypothetical protein
MVLDEFVALRVPQVFDRGRGAHVHLCPPEHPVQDGRIAFHELIAPGVTLAFKDVEYGKEVQIRDLPYPEFHVRFSRAEEGFL